MVAKLADRTEQGIARAHSISTDPKIYRKHIINNTFIRLIYDIVEDPRASYQSTKVKQNKNQKQRSYPPMKNTINFWRLCHVPVFFFLNILHNNKHLSSNTLHHIVQLKISQHY
jgi:hypothetical protein